MTTSLVRLSGLVLLVSSPTRTVARDTAMSSGMADGSTVPLHQTDPHKTTNCLLTSKPW